MPANLTVLVVSLPDGLNDICDACGKAHVTTDQATSAELAMQKIIENDFDMILLNGAEQRGKELVTAAKIRNPSVVIIGFSHDSDYRKLMVEDGCTSAVSMDEAQGEIEKRLEELAR